MADTVTASSASTPASASSSPPAAAASVEPKRKTEGHIICPGHSRLIPDLQFSQVTPDGFFIISSCQDYKAMIREGTTGDWVGTFQGHKGAVWSARLNASASRAATASGDFTARLWDALTGDELYEWAHPRIVKTANFSQDSITLYTGGQDKIIRMFDLNRFDAAPIEMKGGHGATISHTVVLPDPAMILASGDEKGVRLWDTRTKTVVKTLSTNAPITSMELSMDGSVVSAASGKDVFFWDSKTLNLIHTYNLPLRLDVMCVAHHPRTRGFLAGSSSELYAYDFATGKELAVYKGHHGLVKCVAFNPAGDAFASGSEDATLRLWEWAGELSPAAPTAVSAAAGAAPAASAASTPAEEKKAP